MDIPSKGIRVVIADDHPVVRKGLRMTLEEFGAEIELAGEAADGSAVVRLVEEVQPDVVLMDIRMPGMDGLEALEHIRASSPRVAVVILTTYNQDAFLLRGLQAGACGYLLKDCPLETLLHAIRAAARGETLLQPEMVARLLKTRPVSPSSSPSTVRAANMPRFTGRELEILAAIARGERSKEIAASLGLTRRTVETYLTNIYLKLEVDSRSSSGSRIGARSSETEEKLRTPLFLLPTSTTVELVLVSIAKWISSLEKGGSEQASGD